MSRTDEHLIELMNSAREEERYQQRLRVAIVGGVMKLAVEVAGILLLVAFIIWAFSPR